MSSILAIHHYNQTHKKKCKKKAGSCCISAHGAISQQPCLVSVREKLSSVSQQPFPRKGTLHISVQTLKNTFMTSQLLPANNPQVDTGSGHNDANSLGQANFVAATVLWEKQRCTVPALSTCGNMVEAWGLHRPLLSVVCLPCFTSVGESADETAEGAVYFSWDSTLDRAK